MEDDDNIDAQLQLAHLRRKLTGANVEPVCFRRWQIERRLGRGGMGAVYLARDPKLERLVALKVLQVPAGAGRHTMTERLRREALALAQIQHEHVVKVHGVDLEHGRPVIEMEYVDGLTLRQWVKVNRTWREVVEAYRDAARGLAAIHQAQLVHRDVKPDNLLIASDGCVKVADLGLAVGHRSPPTTDNPSATTSSLLATRLTQESTVVGTPGYIAPELFGSSDVTAACDQFGFTVSLFEALFHTLPFTGETPADYALSMRRGARIPSTGVPRWLTRIIHRGLRFDPKDRHSSMAMMVDALDHGLARRRRWFFGGSALATSIALAGAAGGLGWGLGQPPPDPCEAVERQLASEKPRTWLNPVRSMLGPQHPDHLARSARMLAQAVTEQHQEWTLSRLSLCKARHANEPIASAAILAQRQRCLTHTRARLHQVLEGLPTSRDLALSLVEATTAVERLPDCQDPVELHRWASSRQGGTSERLESLLAQAHTLELAGKYKLAEQHARAVVDASEDPSFQWLHADALYRLGHILGVQDRQVEAFDTLERARNVAVSVGYNGLLCDAVLHQSKLVSSIGLDTKTSKRDLDLAEACIEGQRAQSPLVKSDLLEARGLLAQASGKPAQAVSWHRQSLNLRRAYLGPEHHELSRTLVNLANALSETGEAQAAYEQSTLGLELRSEALGPRHPRVADLRFDRGEILRQLGRSDAARKEFEQADIIYREASSPRLSARANVHLALAALDLADNKLRSASEHLGHARMLQQEDSDLDPSDPSRAHLLQAQGALNVRNDDFAAALGSFARATEILRRHDPKHPDVHDGTLQEIEMLYGLEQHLRIANRVDREGPWLVEYLARQSSADQGRYGWYIGDSCLREQRACAARYLRLAVGHYQRQEDEASVAALSWMLARALEESSESRQEAIGFARSALAKTIDMSQKRKIRRWLTMHPSTPTNNKGPE